MGQTEFQLNSHRSAPHLVVERGALFVAVPARGEYALRLVFGPQVEVVILLVRQRGGVVILRVLLEQLLLSGDDDDEWTNGPMK